MKKNILTKFQKEVLNAIGKSEFFNKNFCWGGGTALSYCYLEHRLSEDLDFFSEDLIAQEILLKEFNKLGFKKTSFSEKLNRQRFIIKKGQEILRIEFVYFPFKPLGKLKTLKEFNLKINSLEDLATNKILAAYERFEPKDVFDLYYILKNKKFSLEKLLNNVKKKFEVEIDQADLEAKILKGAERLKNIQPLLFEKKDFFNEIKNFFDKKIFKYLSMFM